MRICCAAPENARYFCLCHSFTYHVRFPASEPGKTAPRNEQTAHETSNAGFVALPELHRRDSAAAAQCRAEFDLAVPAHAVAAGRIQLPPSADLLSLRR